MSPSGSPCQCHTPCNLRLEQYSTQQWALHKRLSSLLRTTTTFNNHFSFPSSHSSSKPIIQHTLCCLAKLVCDKMFFHNETPVLHAALDNLKIEQSTCMVLARNTLQRIKLLAKAILKLLGGSVRKAVQPRIKRQNVALIQHGIASNVHSAGTWHFLFGLFVRL